jgi:large subunit ribosomal protein L21
MTKSDSSYAVVKVGGKQYKVAIGDVIVVDRQPGEVGRHLTLEPLAVRAADGSLVVGTNNKAKVKATVAEHFLGEKIRVFTYKPKTTFRKTHGHRSRLSRLSIDAIEVTAKKEKKSGS